MQIITTKEGWSIIDQDSHVSAWVIESGSLSHDKHLIPICASHMKPGDVVLDLGANLGSHSLAYSQAVGEDGVVFCVEPGKLAFEALQANCKRFPFKNCLPLNFAVSDKQLQVLTHNEIENLGASTCHTIKDAVRHNKDLVTHCVETITIDWMREMADRPIAFIKIDIEGWEYKALLGATKVLAEDKPKMVIEINRHALNLQGDTQAGLLNLVDKSGYDWKIIEPQCSCEDEQFNILCLPK